MHIMHVFNAEIKTNAQEIEKLKISIRAPLKITQIINHREM
jgi:hypothetical protein